jgi:CDP-diacylglycerol--serine O-phosphatidyltransferase
MMRGKTFDSRILPCTFTLANLLFGFLAIIAAFEDALRISVAMIMLSVLMDSLDGKVARKFKANSDFGKELDSLSDVISFGLAPAVLIYVYIFDIYLNFWGMWIAAFFAMCGAVRLARFNLLPSTDYFVGVPITFAGGFMALLLLFIDRIPWQAYPISMIFLGILMVSSVQVPKLGK